MDEGEADATGTAAALQREDIAVDEAGTEGVPVGSGAPSPTGSEGVREGDVGSENATGVGTGTGEEQMLEQLSDVSDAGWDTDLEIEEEKEEYDATGGKDYLRVCETLGIIPASYFLRTIRAQEGNISMSHHGVGPKGAKAIAIALTNNTTTTQLDLSDNGLGTEGGVAIVSMLKENCYITHVDLSDNDMGPPVAIAIAQMISSNNTLLHLALRGNGFDNKAAEPMSELIKSSFRITFLDLSHNQFGEEAGLILGPALADSEVLKYLDLSWNHIRGKGAIAIATGLKSNQTLKTIKLSGNGFGNEGAQAIADALKMNSTLEELDISNNRITQDGAVAIAKVLPANESLKILRIGRNPVQALPPKDPTDPKDQPNGVQIFLDSLQASSSNALQCLDIEGVTATLAVAKTLGEMKETHPHLVVSHGGTGGYKEKKPLVEPLEKLVRYAKEHNVQLNDLFRLFDKEKANVLPEEEFRNALKHIDAPLMEFERQKLIKRFKIEPEPAAVEDKGQEPEEDKAKPEDKPDKKGKGKEDKKGKGKEDKKGKGKEDKKGKGKGKKGKGKEKGEGEGEEEARTAIIDYNALVQEATALAKTKLSH